MSYPKIVKIRQQLDNTLVGDIDSVIRSELNGANISSRIKPGSRVAITAGSRGITDIVSVLASITRRVKEIGASPFIVPAMGSHGGATAEGQEEVLKEYGITESSVGAPIVSSMEVVQIGETPSGIPVSIDKNANGADHIIAVNRIKPHTEFEGQIESGLMKIMVIGLGKHTGALIAHKYAVSLGYERTITEIGQCILRNSPICLGVGIIENGYGQTARIVAVAPENLYETEKKLLVEARKKVAKIPFDRMDVLIVDELGKEISGSGMDTKVIGRIMNIYELEVNHPKITRIVLRDLSKKTRGNAVGVGLADFVTKRVADKIDPVPTYINSITGGSPEKGRLPMVYANDREALDAALATTGPVDSENVRIVWIRNTSKLGEMMISQGLLEETQGKETLEIIDEGKEMEFDRHGDLYSFWENQ
ncbi:MAG: DUF2088 domain-containing protein [Deltaproteobacteria bacterium]|nr:DUF2088 domain-containing protein [Deltaproteobacteria bacterium]